MKCFDSSGSRRFGFALLLALAGAGCGESPDILVEATRTAAENTLSVRACPADVGASECARDYENVVVLPTTVTALSRTLAIHVDDGTTPIRLQLQRDARLTPLKACQLVDVDVSRGPVTLRVAADEDLTRSCDPADRCTNANSCVLAF